MSTNPEKSAPVDQAYQSANLAAPSLTHEPVGIGKRLAGRAVVAVALSMGLVAGEVTAINPPVAVAETGGYPDADAAVRDLATYTWWKDENSNGAFNTGEDISQRGYAYRNCTDWAAYRAAQITGVAVPTGLGNAKYWDDNKPNSWVSDTTPEEGDIAQSEAGAYGHVGVIESVAKNSNGQIVSITVSEYNKAGTGSYSNSTYAPDGQGVFWRDAAHTKRWDHFLDLNGTGTGVGGGAPPRLTAEPWGPTLPEGNNDVVKRLPGGVRLEGWALDRDTDEPIDVHVYAGATGDSSHPEEFRGGFTANLRRDDVSFIGRGPYHGYSYDFPLPNGEEHFCLYGINKYAGYNRRIYCETINVDGTTIGGLDRAFRSPGGIRLQGWAIDPDVAQSIETHFFESDNPDPVYLRGGMVASNVRGDISDGISASFVNYGNGHAYDYNMSLAAGAHHICAFAVNMGGTPGGSSGIGCRDIVVSNEPIGSLDAVTRNGNTVSVSGWGFDPDSGASGTIHLYGGNGQVYPNQFMGGFTANQSRLDVAGAYPGYDEWRGFSVSNVALPPYSVQVCAYVLNAANTPGSSQLIGCRGV